MSLSVRYMDVPVGAKEDATAATTALQPFGSPEQIIDGADDIPWATLEPKSWVLDGSRKILGDMPIDIGWWSYERSGDDGKFASAPEINITFSQKYIATGLALTFWPSMGQWCNSVTVYWYGGRSFLGGTTVSPQSANYVIDKAVEGFDRIVIKLHGTNIPGQFAKIQKIQFGQVVEFGKDELVRVSVLNEIDPSLCELSTDTMTIEVLEKNNRYLIPQKNQAMYLYRNGKQIATQYITDSSRETQNFYTFHCQSAIGRLEDEFLGGVYSEKPLPELLPEILNGFVADWAAFANEKITGYLPVCSKREALQQIAFAIGAVVSTQGDGKIKFSPISSAVEGSFTENNIFSGAKISREAKTATVRLFVHSYSKGEEVDTLIDEKQVYGENLLYVFSAPHHNYQITNGEIEASGDNWVRIRADGDVVLTAKKYVHSISVKTRENAVTTAAERGNVLSVEDATLINAANSDEALNRLYEFSLLKNLLTQEAVITNQKAGQKVRSNNPWGSTTEGYIVAMENEFTNNGHTANVTIRGKEV